MIKTETLKDNIIQDKDFQDFATFAQYFDETPRAHVRIKNNNN